MGVGKILILVAALSVSATASADYTVVPVEQSFKARRIERAMRRKERRAERRNYDCFEFRNSKGTHRWTCPEPANGRCYKSRKGTFCETGN